MIQIEDAIISLDLIERRFCCDLKACAGECCIAGDSGAPLEESEKEELQENYEAFKAYMKPEGVIAVEEQGLTVIDSDGDLVTPLIHGRECAYAIDENGCCWCAIEKAWMAGESHFRKPISCHLYPVRITKYQRYEAVNYDSWHICAAARRLGEQEGIPVYVFLKDALIRKYGQEWYDQLCYVAQEIQYGKLKL